MPLITYAALNKTAAAMPKEDNREGLIKIAAEYKKGDSFDVFLSHSSQDKKLVIQVRNHLLKQYQIHAYVDWIDDPNLDRKNVNAKTAERLRERMKQCKALAFLDTENARASDWTPWEVGFMDADKKRVFIIPIRKEEISYLNYKGIEYFSLYPFLDEAEDAKSQAMCIWINSQEKKYHYRKFNDWIEHGEPLTDYS